MSEKPAYRPLMMQDVLDAQGKSGLIAASTFAGAGGSSLGYRLAGFSMRWVNEFEPNAVATYEKNKQAGCIIDNRDIRDVSGEELLAAIGIQRGELDVFDGSPPCQSFSTAGKRERGWGRSIAHADGTRQRSDDLFEEYVRLIDEIRPRIFIAENVTGLVKGVAKGYFKMVLQAMLDLGYDVQAAVLDARWLGVPQARQRVIFFGIRADIAKAVGPINRWPQPHSWFYSVADACPWIAQHGTSTTFDEKWKASGRDPLTTLVDSERNAAPTITASGMSGGARTAIQSLRRGHPNTNDPIDSEIYILSDAAKAAWEETSIGKAHKKHFSCLRVAPEKASPTIAATGSPGMHGLSHPYEPRRFTILELKRLCSFPDDFEMVGNFNQRWARLGNAVPPLMMRAVAEKARDILLKAKSG